MTALLRRTCPADDRCPWRGVVIKRWNDYERTLASSSIALRAHLRDDHPDVDPSNLYETWERVHAVEPIKARDAVAYLLILGFVAVAVVSVLRLVRG